MRRKPRGTRSGTDARTLPVNCASAAGSCYDERVTSFSATGSERADELSQRGLDLLASGDSSASAEAFRAAIAADSAHIEAHHGLIRALRESEQYEAAVAAALALTVLTPQDPLAHTSLSIALQKAGHVPEAESAAARARILEWKQQLAKPEGFDAAKESDPFA
jgi:tetratricopeptide (TPR) repeat protein